MSITIQKTLFLEHGIQKCRVKIPLKVLFLPYLYAGISGVVHMDSRLHKNKKRLHMNFFYTNLES